MVAVPSCTVKDSAIVAIFSIFSSVYCIVLLVQAAMVDRMSRLSIGPGMVGGVILAVAGLVQSIAIITLGRHSLLSILSFELWSIVALGGYGLIDLTTTMNRFTMARMFVQGAVALAFGITMPILVLSESPTISESFTTTRIVVWIWSWLMYATLLFEALMRWKRGASRFLIATYAIVAQLVIGTLGVDAVHEAWHTEVYIGILMVLITFQMTIVSVEGTKVHTG